MKKSKKNLKKLKINTISDLASFLECDSKEIAKLAQTADSKYITKNGFDKKEKEREFDIPQGRLREIQRTLAVVLKRIYLPLEIYSYVKGRDSKGNAEHHLNCEFILKLDIKEFFPSITDEHVRRMFFNLGCSPEISNVLASITTFQGKLPLGTSCSPAIANLVLIDVGFLERSLKLCEQYRFKISIYSDDITLSGKKHLKKFINLFVKIIEQCGFDIKESKIKYIPKTEEQIITGFRIDRNKIELPSVTMLAYKEDINNLEIIDNEKLFKQIQSLLGKLGHAKRANSKQGDELRKLFCNKLRNH